MSDVFEDRDWSRIRLVVFDVDGTLYDQRPIRFAMARRLLFHALLTRRARDVRALAAFRRAREAAAERQLEGFEQVVIAETAAVTGSDPGELEALVRDWIETRPLPLLRAARAAGVEPLFAALRASGRRIAVWSDHPVREKVAALGLQADDMAAATDPELDRLKPDPAGLRLLMARAGVQPAETLMIGDRADRDGEAARRAGVSALLRGGKAAAGFATFRRYDDAIFASVLRA